MKKIIDDSMPYHPCHGIECKECSKCIFDEEVFPPSQAKEKEETKYCDKCPHMDKLYTNEYKTTWHCVCNAKILNGKWGERPARITFNAHEYSKILTPDWCPLLDKNKKQQQPKQQDMFLDSYTPQYSSPSSSKPYKTQREMVEEITPTLKVDELEIGKLYVIPSFSYNDTKVIKIVSKYPSSITYKEISNLNTMSESAYSSTLFNSSTEMHIITPYRPF